MSAARTKPIALGIVHGCSGAPASVSGGGGPERSRPLRRLNVREVRATARRPRPPPGRAPRRWFERPAVAFLLPAADLQLEVAGLERALADGGPDRAAQQLGLGELLP